MSVHQIIYTSCKRGIHGVNDGQQVFSYDAQFKGWNDDEIKSLFSYQPPALAPGVIMTEEIATTLPKAFIFRKLDSGNCTLTLSSYLGRDYMGSAGRFGNHLSHVVVADSKSFTHYPCEYYGGSLLRDRMEFEEVNNPNPPDYLPSPILEKGYAIDVDAVLEFLGIGDRLEVYKNMLYAMLAFERERKRVVVCDEPEHIVMWIAALEYAIPLKAALNINFTTYEFDPALSVSQICGVAARGTRYNNESKRLHFVFDLLQNDCVEFEKEMEFYDFIDTAFSLSFDSMQDFHAFLTTGYSYQKADEEMYSAYALYSLLSDGINEIKKERLEIALSFAEKYASSEEKIRIARNLLSQYKQLIGVEKPIFLDILKYILSMRKAIDNREFYTIKNMAIDKIFNEILKPEINEDSFTAFFYEIDKICKQCGVSLTTELMQDDNRNKLFAVVQHDAGTWKIAFIIKILSNYAKEKRIPVNELKLDRNMGHVYYEIMKTVYSRNVQSGFFLVTCILDEFNDECDNLVNMSLNVENMLLDIPNGKKEVPALWEYFGQKMVSAQMSNFDVAYNILAKYERYKQIFMLFTLELQEATDTATSKNVFEKHFNEFVSKNHSYASMYGQNVLSLYFEKLTEFDSEQNNGAKQELFELLVNRKISTAFSDELVRELLKDIPLEKPSKQNEKFIHNTFQYTYKFRKQHVTDKLLLLVIGMIIEGMDSQTQFKEKISQLSILTQDGQADLTNMPEKSVDAYFGWVLPSTCSLCLRNEEMAMFFNLFHMSAGIEKLFFTECASLCLKQCKDKKDYRVFAEYFGFVCEYGNTQIREELSKQLCKLNKSRMAELDEIIRDMYVKNRQIMTYWEEVKNAAESTNSILNNISGLFKRRKREE